MNSLCTTEMHARSCDHDACCARVRCACALLRARFVLVCNAFARSRVHPQLLAAGLCSREPINSTQGTSTRSEGGDPRAPREAINALHGRRSTRFKRVDPSASRDAIHAIQGRRSTPPPRLSDRPGRPAEGRGPAEWGPGGRPRHRARVFAKTHPRGQRHASVFLSKITK